MPMPTTRNDQNCWPSFGRENEHLLVHQLRRCILLFGFFFVCGCSTQLERSTGTGRTLGADNRLPGSRIELLLPHQKWAKLRDLEYEAFVVMKAGVDGDGALHGITPMHSYPDQSRYNLAAS